MAARGGHCLAWLCVVDNLAGFSTSALAQPLRYQAFAIVIPLTVGLFTQKTLVSHKAVFLAPITLNVPDEILAGAIRVSLDDLPGMW
jgi:hypothetical protein